MVKLLDIEMSGGGLVLRILAALILFSLSCTVLFLAPRVAMDFSKGIENLQIQEMVNQLLDPVTPSIGLVVSVNVLLLVIIRRTKLEGPALICLGVGLFAYGYTLFHGGVILLQVPVTGLQQALGFNVPMSIQATITLGTATLMLASICPSILIIFKGVLLTVMRFRKTPI